MSLKNSEHHYGWLAVVLHWLVAAVVVGLFALGFWMVDLSYYDEWYRKGPDLHRSIGLILFAVVVFRLLWRFINTSPRPLASHKRWEVISAHVAHSLLYVLMFVAMVSGYLITTADGSSISVFGLFDVPSLTGRVRGWKIPPEWFTTGVPGRWSAWREYTHWAP